MKPYTFRPAVRIAGDIHMPGDKSISHRAIMLGSIAAGRTTVEGLADCDDCGHTIKAFRQMGVDIRRESHSVRIEGKGLRGLRKPLGPVNVGSSGTTMRVLAGVLAGQDFESVLAADASLSVRPMKRIIEPLTSMGASIKSMAGWLPPLSIRGPVRQPISYDMPVASAQVKSAILFAGMYLTGSTRVRERTVSRDHTERMMRYFGADLKVEGSQVSITGGRLLKGCDVKIPGDISSASFFIAAATIVPGSRLIIRNVGVNTTRMGFVDVLRSMGGRIECENMRELQGESVADIVVESGETKGVDIPEDTIPRLIDELPVLFVVAALSKGQTVIRGVQELRVKETDRIASMVSGIGKMGGRIHVDGNDVIVEGVERFKGTLDLESRGDHRTCMSMAVASLRAEGSSAIDDIGCVAKSFPEFQDMFDRVVTYKV